MKEPNSGASFCSSFWLFSGGSPGGYGEIDVQENESQYAPDYYDEWKNFHKGQGKSQLRNAIAFGTPGDASYIWPYAETIDIRDANNNLIDITQTFHTYGLDWQPNYIDFYMDGILKTHATSFNYTNDNKKTSVKLIWI
jgi:beta-glucanase (GH16 family)